MKEYYRQYPLFSACGLNCGLCPRYYTDGTSRCPGCAGENFSAVHPSCGILSCCHRKGIEYCYLCDEYPCKKYEGADLTDSFITHRNQLKDLEKAKNIGIAAYQTELDEKVNILQSLIENYNDGRRKNFYCIAVNLLKLSDIKDVMKQITNRVKADAPIKERSLIAIQLFHSKADERNIVLKLNKK